MPVVGVYQAYLKKVERKGGSESELITGTICGVKIDEIQDPLMKKIRYMEKIVDELASGRQMEMILRSDKAASTKDAK